MRAAAYPDVRRALQAQWTHLIEAFAETDPAAPSRVPGWTVSDLERHLVGNGRGLGLLAAGPLSEGPAVGIAAWARALPGLAHRLAEEVRTDPGLSLGAMVANTLAALDAADPSRLVDQWTGVHQLADATLFQLIEAVVHALDLPDPPGSDPAAQRIVVRALAGLLATSFPGRSVELRIPPAAAVQLIEGPRHTRGTPPGVVETDPVTFLLVATGRLAWAAALEQGQIRASGERTDLSGYLPLLR